MIKIVLAIIMLCLLTGCLPSLEKNTHNGERAYQDERLKIVVPTRLKAEQIFTLDFTFFQGAEQISARLISASMSMGIVPLLMEPLNEKNSFGKTQVSKEKKKYRATTLVGRCSEQVMIWHIEVHWQQNGSAQMVTVPLEIAR